MNVILYYNADSRKCGDFVDEFTVVFREGDELVGGQGVPDQGITAGRKPLLQHTHLAPPAIRHDPP